MVVIRLYGVLEQLAQRTLRVHVESFDEALDALFANFPKLRSVIADMKVSVLVNGRVIGVEDCMRPMTADNIDIMPVIGGNGPAVIILAGAALTASAATIGTYLAGTALFAGITAAAISASIAQFGIAMILGGITQVLFKPPKPNASMGSDSPENTPSYIFNGAVNATTQGNVVAVGFGRMRVGSVTISANIQTWGVPIPAAPAPELPPAPPPVPDDWNSPSYGLQAG